MKLFMRATDGNGRNIENNFLNVDNFFRLIRKVTLSNKLGCKHCKLWVFDGGLSLVILEHMLLFCIGIIV